MAHEQDRIAFQPGGRVDVGFTPRAADRWPVDGGAPSALPAGRATGRQMAASRAGQRAGSDVGAAARRHGHRRHLDAAGRAHRCARRQHRSSAAPASPCRPTARAAFDLAAAAGLRRQVFGFLPYWELSGAASKLNYDVLSTIAYFSVGATATGNLKKRQRRRPPTTGWGGWTSSSMTSVINDAHQHGTRVVLTVSVFAWTTAPGHRPEEAPGQLPRPARNLARQVAAAVRDRGADGVNLDFEPLASGYAGEFVALLKSIRSELNKVKHGYQLTYDTTGSIGNYPLEASVGSGAADAIFVMGYDYRTSGSSTRGLHRPALRSEVRPHRHRPRLHGARQPVARDPRPALVRPRLVHDVERRALRQPERSEVRLQHGRQLRDPDQPRRQVRPAVGSGRAEPVPRLPAPELHQHLWLRHGWRQVYYEDGASLKLRLAMVNDYGLRGGGHVGARLRRRSPRAVPRVRRVVPRRQGGAAGRDPDARHHAGRRGVHRHLVGAGRQRHRELRRPGLGRRRRLGDLADRDAGDIRGVARPRRTWLRLPGASPRQQGQHRQLERRLDLGCRSVARPWAGSAGSWPTASPTGPAPARLGGEARDARRRARSWP